MIKKYKVNLTESEREKLLEIISKGKNQARVIKRANILLLRSEGETYVEIAEKLRIGVVTIFRICKKFTEKGIDYALTELDRTGAPKILDGKQEAFLIATACTDPPEGRKRWTMKLLADKLIELEIVESISEDTVERTLKKGMLSLVY